MQQSAFPGKSRIATRLPPLSGTSLEQIEQARVFFQKFVSVASIAPEILKLMVAAFIHVSFCEEGCPQTVDGIAAFLRNPDPIGIMTRVDWRHPNYAIAWDLQGSPLAERDRIVQDTYQVFVRDVRDVARAQSNTG